MSKLLFIKSAAAIALFSAPLMAIAAGIINPLGNAATFEGLLISLTNWLLGIVVVLSVLGVIYAGIRMIIAIGNEQGLASAKKILFWSIAGLVVAVLALTVINIVVTGILGITHSSPHIVPTAYAQVDIAADLDEIEGSTGLAQKTARELGVAITKGIAGFIAILSLVVFILGAVMMVISLGNDQRVATAKSIMLYSVIGLLLAGGAWVIIQFIGQTLGVI